MANAEIKRLAKVWQTSYEWRIIEAQLNKLLQYFTLVEVDEFGDVQLQRNTDLESEKKGLQRVGHLAKEDFCYYKQQSTKPLTIGYRLRDSPIGLLAWLYEKIADWSDRYPWTEDEILIWVSIYYAMEHSKPPAFEAASSYLDVSRRPLRRCTVFK